MPWRCKTVKILLRNAILFDGVSLFGKETDVSIDGGLIEAIGDADLGRDFDVIHDLSGKILCPGFIDPSLSSQGSRSGGESGLSSGSSAGAAGGFTTLVCMPNTDPPLDSPALVLAGILKRAEGPRFEDPARRMRQQGEKGQGSGRDGQDAVKGWCCYLHQMTEPRERILGLLPDLPSSTAPRLGVRLYGASRGEVSDQRCTGQRGYLFLLLGAQGVAIVGGGLRHFQGRLSLQGYRGPHSLHSTSARRILSVSSGRRESIEASSVTFDVTPHHLCLSRRECHRGRV